MSVTFSHTAEPIISGWFLECGCREWESAQEYANRDDAVAALVAGDANGCTDEYCAGDQPFISPRYVGMEPVSANFSNTNARHLLALLGVHDEDLMGGMSTDDFERALVLAEPTEGVPTLTTVAVGGERVTVEGHVADTSAVRFIECGRDAGYDIRAIDALREVVVQARELHADEITWG